MNISQYYSFVLTLGVRGLHPQRQNLSNCMHVITSTRLRGEVSLGVILKYLRVRAFFALMIYGLTTNGGIRNT